VVVFPALTLVLLVLSVNIIGDWLRDLLNPKLR
jgi:peptide/nickel transport system permease protein